jgi:hypothetical protein
MYIFGQIPFFPCLVRREFTTNLQRGHGDFLSAIAVGVRMQRGLSVYFQVWFQEGDAAGAMFSVPIQALVHSRCEIPDPSYVQPWDVFSSHFTCMRMDLFYRSRCYLLPNRLPGRYVMTFDFEGSDLAEFQEQHKHLHLVAAEGGWFAAVPNNRLLIEDHAFLDGGVGQKRPDFTSLAPEFYSE